MNEREAARGQRGRRDAERRSSCEVDGERQEREKRLDSLHPQIDLWDTSQHPQTIRNAPFLRLFLGYIQFIFLYYLEQFFLGVVGFIYLFSFSDCISFTFL